MDYTQYLENKILDFIDEDDECTPEVIIEFLNDSNSFYDFGRSLTLLTRKYMPFEYRESEESYLKEMAAEKGIDLARTTVRNWYKGIRPKKGKQSREHMYRISFALGLDLEDTSHLFRKIYLDKPFNMRSIDEFVYYYCIKNGLEFNHARKLIERAKKAAFTEDEGTIYTQMMHEAMDMLSSDEQVIAYIVTHPHNFQIGNRTAWEELQRLLGRIRVRRGEEKALAEGKITIKDSNYSYIIREISFNENWTDAEDEDIKGKHKTYTSIETMLDIITKLSTRGSSKGKSGKKLFEKDALPKEITNRFPIKKSFSTKPENLSFEEMRKMIILLFSYEFWFHKEYLSEIEEDVLEDYAIQLDMLLQKCGLQTLYYGNPFDWLFLYCTMSEYPLFTFREIMDECGKVW